VSGIAEDVGGGSRWMRGSGVRCVGCGAALTAWTAWVAVGIAVTGWGRVRGAMMTGYWMSMCLPECAMMCDVMMLGDGGWGDRWGTLVGDVCV